MKKISLFILSTLLIFSACEKLAPRQPGLMVPRTVAEDPSIPSIAVNGTLLHAEAFGNPADPMIVILHGGPGSDYRYMLNCRDFVNEGYYVVFYDQRGSGLSRREPKSSYTSEVMVDDLSGVIAHYRTSATQKVFLFGRSSGAIVATSFINKYPSAVQGAILTEPGGFVWSDIKAYVKRAQQYGITSEALNDVTYVDQFLTGDEREQAILDYKMGLAAAAGVSEGNPTGIAGLEPFWRYGYIVNQALFELGDREQPDWTKNLAGFEPTVLFFYSELNKAYGQVHALHVSSAYPQVQLERIENVGHDMTSSALGWSRLFPIALTYLNQLK